MNTVLDEIEALDARILNAADVDVEPVAILIEHRSKLSCRLLSCLESAGQGKGMGQKELARISEILANTKRIQMQIGLLNNKAVGELNLLERQDQLLHLLQPLSGEPCYMDYSA